jgi:hypothetical protein
MNETSCIVHILNLFLMRDNFYFSIEKIKNMT